MKTLFLLLTIITLPTPAYAQAVGEDIETENKAKPSRIYATAWGMTLADDGSGFYNDLARLILAPIIDDIRYDIIPYRRANRIFSEDKSACHYPSTLNYMAATGIVADTSSLIESYFFIRSIAHVFAPYDIDPPHEKADIAGKIIAYPMGAEVPKLLDGLGAYFIPVTAESDKASMLVGKRVELMIAYMPDAKFVFDKLGRKLAPYDPNFTINDDNIAIVCHNTPENAALIARVNAQVRALRDSGKLAVFLEQHGIDPSFYLGPLERKSLGH